MMKVPEFQAAMERTVVDRKFYTTYEVATMLGIIMKSVYLLLIRNAFRSIRLPGGIYRIPKTAFDAWLNAQPER